MGVHKKFERDKENYSTSKINSRRYANQTRNLEACLAQNTRQTAKFKQLELSFFTEIKYLYVTCAALNLVVLFLEIIVRHKYNKLFN